MGDTMLKRKCLSLYLTTLFLLVFYVNIINATSLPLINTIITIDPGHGGRDSGTLYNNILEKDLNLEISKQLDKELSKNGAITYMIRNKDTDLSSIYDSRKKRGDLYRRLLLIRNNKSDLYLSIHINWYKNSNYQGAEVLYNPINTKNELLATSIMEEFKTTLKSQRNIKKTDLYMYRNTKTPGVLIECGYLSNPNERYLMSKSTYQRKIAKAITKGVVTYIKKLNKDKYIL